MPASPPLHHLLPKKQVGHHMSVYSSALTGLRRLYLSDNTHSEACNRPACRCLCCPQRGPQTHSSSHRIGHAVSPTNTEVKNVWNVSFQLAFELKGVFFCLHVYKVFCKSLNLTLHTHITEMKNTWCWSSLNYDNLLNFFVFSAIRYADI